MLPGAGAESARLLSTLERLLELDATELRPTLDRASRLVCEALGADKVDVFLHEADGDILVAAGASDTPLARRQKDLGLDRMPIAEGGPPVEVFRSGISYLTDRADRDPNQLGQVVEGLAVRSQLVCPLEVAGERRGIVQAAATAPDCFAQRDLHFLEAVARWIGMIIQRAELVEWLAREAEERGRREALAGTLSLLTPRERQIAALIAAGLSNERIAEELVITKGTVANHVQNILMRLGLSNRTQIAVWASERGLHRSKPDESPAAEEVDRAE